MASVIAHERIEQRHPELDEDDVRDAWDAAIMSMPRLPDRPDEYVVLGFDERGRLLEMVGVRGEKGDRLFFMPLRHRPIRHFASSR